MEANGSSTLQAAQSTAFRQAEKHWKLNMTLDKRRARKRQGGWPLPDLSPVVDLRDPAQVTLHTAAGVIQPHAVEATGPAVPAVGAQQQPDDCGVRRTAYTLPAHPGLLVIPAALPPAQQLALIADSFTTFCEAPARTNHYDLHGHLPGIWRAAQAGHVLLQAPQQQHSYTAAAAAPCATVQHSGCGFVPPNKARRSDREGQAGDATPGSGCWGPKPLAGTQPAGKPPVPALEAATMLRRLRWAVLGPHYDWCARRYVHHAPHRPLPDELRRLATHWAKVADGLGGYTTPTAPYRPDVALVNYYYEGDTIMGHCDDVEPDLTQPIVSVSLGADAIFLMGTRSKADAPTPLLLRSGDVLVLAGPARNCYHGLPRVLIGRPLPSELELWLREACDVCRAAAFAPFLQHMASCRINLSIRAVR